jgi:hypothetical protein
MTPERTSDRDVVARSAGAVPRPPQLVWSDGVTARAQAAYNGRDVCSSHRPASLDRRVGSYAQLPRRSDGACCAHAAPR